MTEQEELQLLSELEKAQESGNARAELEILKKLDAANPLPQGNMANMVLEPLATMASGSASAVVGGLAGLGQAMNPGAPEGAGAQTVREIQESGTYIPKTREGAEALQTLQEFVQNGVELTRVPVSILSGLANKIFGGDNLSAVQTAVNVNQQGLPKVVGEEVFEQTNSPLAATAVETLPATLESILGLRGVTGLKLPGDITPAARQLSTGQQQRLSQLDKFFSTNTQEGIQQKQALRIINNDAGGDLAPFKVDKTGNLIDDEVAKEAIKQGFEPADIQSIKTASRLDKLQMRKILNRYRRGLDNRDNQTDFPPDEIIGKSLQRRLKFLRDERLAAGDELETVAESLKGKPVNISTAINNFGNKLEEFGIELVPDGKGGFKPDYSDTELAPADRGAITEIIRQMSRLSKKGNPDAFTAHKFKRIIDRNVKSFGQSEGGLGADPQNALKTFRHEIDEALDTTFPRYDAVNTKYRDTKTAFDGLQELAGKKRDVLGDGGAKTLSKLARRITSHAISAGEVSKALKEADIIVEKYGGNIQDSVTKQLQFANVLNTRFKSMADTSLQGEIGKEVSKVMRQNKEEFISDKVGQASAKIQGLSDENALKALDQLLRE